MKELETGEIDAGAGERREVVVVWIGLRDADWGGGDQDAISRDLQALSVVVVGLA